MAQKIVSYSTLSISSLNIHQFSQCFSLVDSVINLLLTGMRTTPTMSESTGEKIVKIGQYLFSTIAYYFLGHPVRLES